MMAVKGAAYEFVVYCILEVGALYAHPHVLPLLTLFFSRTDLNAMIARTTPHNIKNSPDNPDSCPASAVLFNGDIPADASMAAAGA
jgi:hypothetical protein